MTSADSLAKISCARLADDPLARNAEMIDRGLVDQHVAPGAHVLDHDRGRHVLDDLVEEQPVAVAVLLETDALRHVLDDADQIERLAVGVADGVAFRGDDAFVVGLVKLGCASCDRAFVRLDRLDVEPVDHPRCWRSATARASVLPIASLREKPQNCLRGAVGMHKPPLRPRPSRRLQSARCRESG